MVIQITPGSGTSDEPIVLGAGAFDAALGSPTYGRWGAANLRGGWLLDDTATEALHGQFAIPSGWTTVDIYIVWAKATTNNGDVRWRLRVSDGADGEVPNEVASSDVTDVTAPTTQYELAYTLTAALTGIAVTAGELVDIKIGRLGGSANDTLAGDIAFTGVKIVKAS